MDVLVEDMVSKPYILYITSKQEFELRNYMEQMEWKIRIFFCIHPESRPTINSLLTEELKVNSDEESRHIASKTYHVNDVKFTEVSLFKDIAEVYNILSFVSNEKETENSETEVLFDVEKNLDDFNSVANLNLKAVKDSKTRNNYCKNLHKQDHRSIRTLKKRHDIKTNRNSQKDVKDICDDICDNNVDGLTDTDFTDEQDNEYMGGQGTSKKLDVEDAVDKNVDREIKQRKVTSKLSTPNTVSRYIRGIGKSTEGVKVNGKRKSISERHSTLKCNICGKALASEKFYERHMKIKHSDKPNRNDYPDVETRKRVSSDHANVCTVCQKQFCDKYTLQTHTRHMHSDNLNGHQCHLCGAVLKFKGSLAQHMKSVHTDERPHRCTVCNKQFKVLHQLKNHQRRHDPDHIDTCTICGKTVKKGQLSGHIKRHRDDKKHACSTCEKRFFEKQDLLRHLRIHSGEKPFKCSHCSYTCAIKGNLTKHIIHKHKEGQFSLEFNKPMQYDTKRPVQDNRQPPVEEKTTTVYVLESSEPDVGPQGNNETLVNRTDNIEITNLGNTPVYSIMNTSTSLCTSISQTQDVSIHNSKDSAVDRSRSVHTTCTDPYGVAPVYPDGATVYYNMRPVVRVGQTDDQIMTSGSGTREMQTQSQIDEGHVLDGSRFTYTSNLENTPRYTYQSPE